MKTESDKEFKIRQVSEQNNPYDPECPNRHLWSEGFRNGNKFNPSPIDTDKLREEFNDFLGAMYIDKYCTPSNCDSVFNWFIANYKPQDKWISVQERLPKDGDEIIFRIPRETRKGVFIEVDDWKRENAFCDGSFHFIPSVTFWQPLPQPPTK
ncbi:MAG: DUF551 domain-containing protein [Bacteroidota bacterium]